MPGPDLALLTGAAEAAGKIAMRWWKKGPQVFDKGIDGPVTEADLAVNRMLLEELRKARPDYGWLSEETPDDPVRLQHERVFIVDPIDGTRAFIAGETAFAVALAVAERGQVISAAIHMPAMGRTYSAEVGQGAACDGAPIRVTGRSGIEGAQLLATKSAMAPEHWPGGLPAIQRNFRASIAYRLARVAEGREDGMLTIGPTWEWDAAAGALIAAEAGATVTGSRGEALSFNNTAPAVPGVLAATPALHAALLPLRQAAAAT